jgi:NAD(P)-dependent dehydrogenase (short-subunit alcohol dehydrogenase family)
VTTSLENAAVVIIGGSSGIGLATAKIAHDAGAQVTIAGRSPDRLTAARDEIGGDIRTVALDIADEDAVRALFDSLESVDHVVNLAGTFAFGALLTTDIAALRSPVDTRFWGPVYVCKYAAPRMTTGSLTFCTGTGVDRPRPGGAVFSAAAGGSEVFSRAMALELAPIRVNVVRPGTIDTPLFARSNEDRERAIAERSARIPLRRIGRAEEIAHAIHFLMTNEYVTGVTLPVDGGASLT